METTRLELVTSCMSSKHSNQLSYASGYLVSVSEKRLYAAIIADRGRSDRIRTCGIDVPNVARYQLRHAPASFRYTIIANRLRFVKCVRKKTQIFQKIFKKALDLTKVLCYDTLYNNS